jgi:hypothetical protein
MSDDISPDDPGWDHPAALVVDEGRVVVED